MTLISVHYAHYPTSVAKHTGLVCVGVFFAVGVGMVNTAMCFLVAAAHKHNFAHDLSVWGMIILRDKDFKKILGGQNIIGVILRDGRDVLELFRCRCLGALKENSHAVTSLFVDCARKCDNCTFSSQFYLWIKCEYLISHHLYLDTVHLVFSCKTIILNYRLNDLLKWKFLRNAWQDFLPHLHVSTQTPSISHPHHAMIPLIRWLLIEKAFHGNIASESCLYFLRTTGKKPVSKVRKLHLRPDFYISDIQVALDETGNLLRTVFGGW